MDEVCPAYLTQLLPVIHSAQPVEKLLQAILPVCLSWVEPGDANVIHTAVQPV